VPLLLMIGLAPTSAAQLSPAVARIINSHLDESLGPLEFRSVERRVISGDSRVENAPGGAGRVGRHLHVRYPSGLDAFASRF
jgi:hypothetical protein